MWTCLSSLYWIGLAQLTVPWNPATAVDRNVPNVPVPVQDVREYFCEQAETTIITGGDSTITPIQIERARNILVDMCSQSATFRQVLGARPSGEQPRNFVQFTLDSSPSRGISFGSTSGVAVIDMSADSNQDLSTTEMFVRDNFIAIVAHEASHVSGIIPHDVPLYLNVAQTMVQMQVAPDAGSRIALDPDSPVTQEECLARGILLFLQGQGPRCPRLPAGV